MLSWSEALQRLKDEISYPFQILELKDEELIDYGKRAVLTKFEKYIPDKNRITMNFSDSSLKVEGRKSEYYLFDPDDREVLNVVDFIPKLGTMLLNDHPYYGAYTHGELGEWALQQHKSGVLTQFSNYNYTTEFMPPNKFRLSPSGYSGNAVVEYERTHDKELSTIYPDLADDFIDLSLGMWMMRIGRIRQKFTSYNTPFGEINVNGDLIYNDGKEIFDRVTEKFENRYLMNVVFDSG